MGAGPGRQPQKLRRLGATACIAAAAALAPGALALNNSVSLIDADTGPITNYLGSGIRIGQLELNVPNSNHLFLLSRIVLTTNLISGTAGSVSSHPTEVAGVMVSTSATYRGVAPAARVYSVGFAGATLYSQVIDAAFFLATQHQVRVMNQSAGEIIFNTLGNNPWERGLDHLVATASVIFVQAAGNSGPGANTIINPAAAFNVISVGSVQNLATNPPVSSFSSRGYLADGRSKPDIVAPGGNIVMPTHPPGTPPTNVAVNSGTSYAAPHVAGVAARLLEVGASNFAGGTLTAAQDPRVIKAVLLNTAIKLPGWSQLTTVGGGITNIVRPLDPDQGAGLVNAARAYNQLVAGKYKPTIEGAGGSGPLTNAPVPGKGWDFFSVNLGLTNIYRVSALATGELRLTLDWYRDVGPGPTYTVQGLGNLDLYLWSSPDNLFTGLTLVARSISTNDNVEHLYFTNLPGAYYQFGVYYSNYYVGAGPPLASINYGLAWSLQTLELQVIPEPSILLLLTCGAVLIHWRRRWKATG
jgi:hypothetical protein